jgi:exosortase
MLTRPRRSWKAADFLLLAGLLAVAVWLQRQPLADIIGIGLHDQEQSHIFLAPLVAIWLFWLRRGRVRFVQVQPSIVGTAIVALGWLVSWWGFDQGTQIAWHAGALLTLIGVVLTMTGLTPLRLFAPVFLVLLFTLPVPGEIRHRIAYPLQELATNVTHSVLEIIGVSTIKSGNILIINGEQVAVGEACNGMRMVFALSLVVYAFAFSTPLRFGTRMFLLALSPVIAMLCNVIRLVPTSLIFGFGSMRVAQQFHDWAGWVMLPVAMIFLAGVLRTIRWLDFPVRQFRLVSQ